MKKKIIKTIIIFAVVAVALILIEQSYRFYIESQREKTSVQIDQYIDDLTLSDETIEEELQVMLEWLDSSLVADDEKGKLCERISNIYSIKNDTIGYYRYLSYALYYLEENGNYELAGNIYADLAKYFILNSSVENAQQMLDELYGLKSVEDYENLQFKSYIYRIQGCIDYKNGDYESAVEQIQISLAVLEEVEDKSQYYAAYKAMSEILLAEVYFEQGELEAASEIVEQYRDNELLVPSMYTKYVVGEFIVPYYKVSCKLYLSQDEIGKAEEELEKLMEYCEKYSFRRQELDTVLYIMQNLKRDDFAQGDAQLREQLDRAVYEAYLNLTNIQSEDYSSLAIGYMQHCANEIISEKRDTSARIENYLKNTAIAFISLFAIVIIWIILKDSKIDVLTGVNNKKVLLQNLDRAKRIQENYYMIMIDIDDFKVINDSFGHKEGDKVLKQLGEIIRWYHTKHTKAYRFGGEEFVLICKGVSMQWVLNLAESLRKSVQDHDWESHLKVTISVGVAASEYGSALEQADANLYYSKRHGKNVVTYSDENKDYHMIKKED